VAGEVPKNRKALLSEARYSTVAADRPITVVARSLSEAFYARVACDPVLRPLFPGSMRCAIEGFAAFLTQFLGGPCEYSERRSSLSLRESHLRFKIGPNERDAWMTNMRQALDDVRIEDPLRGALLGFFEESSTYLINQPPDQTRREIAKNWDMLRAIEEAVAAVRKGDANTAIALAEGSLLQTCFGRDRGALLSLLAMMSGLAPEYVRGKLLNDRDIVKERYTYGRTLLHDVAGEGDLPIVELLLSLGADPNAKDQAGHTPLYFVGNRCHADTGGNIVRALVQGGADVDAQDGVKHCTPLHMAARRGHVRVGEALLECGANIEARDSNGETPLRRAVNCRKQDFAAMLISRGADVHSRCKKGITAQSRLRS
jgi:truncated hemoglobin YjbI